MAPAALKALSAREAYTICGITASRDPFGLRITQVATLSSAHRAGLVQGDLIEQSTYLPGYDLLKLNIRRGRQKYSVKLHPRESLEKQSTASSGEGAIQEAAKASVKIDPRALAAQNSWNRIKDSDIVFMMDMSYNMNSPMGDTGLGRWEWAAQRIAGFAEKVAGQSGKTFTISECARYEYRLRDQSPQGVLQYLMASAPRGPANLSTPLTNIVHEHLDTHNPKPLLVVVFTAGHPELGTSFEPVIQDICSRVRSADSVRIVFVQIGEDLDGTAMLQMLDDDLTYTGMRYDIVDFINFSELQSSGLSKAILDTFEKPRATGNTIAPEISPALTRRIEQLQKRLEQAH